MSCQQLSEESDLSTFQRWSVAALKDFLRCRGLRTTGPKQELAALAFSAHVMKVAVKLTPTERETLMYRQYSDLLEIDGTQYPDPLSVLKDGWIGEKDGMKIWPPTMYFDLCTFLLTDTKNVDLAKRVFRDYKEKKGFSFLSSNFLFEVFLHPISSESPFYFLKADCRPSQNINNPPHTAWVIIHKEGGDIKRAYCTCIAGRGQSCLHVAAMLMKVDLAWKYGLTNPACTSRECSWLTQKPLMNMAPQLIRDLDIKSPNYSRNDVKRRVDFDAKYAFVPHNPEKGASFKQFLDSVREVNPNAVVFSEVEERVVDYSQQQSTPKVVTPAPLMQIALNCQTVEQLKEGLSTECVGKAEILSHATTAQSQSEDWCTQRLGRLTASKFHEIMTKTKTFLKSPRMDVTKDPLVNRIIHGESFSNKYVKYGSMMENTAKEKYKVYAASQHQELTCTDSGLVIAQGRPYIGASPDGIIKCKCHGRGVLEIKCPYTSSHTAPSEITCSFLSIEDGMLKLKHNHKYYTQIQGQMGVLGVSYCDLWVFSMHGHHHEIILFDAAFWEKLSDALDIFFDRYLAPAILAEVKRKSLVSSGESTSACNILSTNEQVSVAIETAEVEVESTTTEQLEFLCKTCRETCKQTDDIKQDRDNSIGCDLCGSWFHWRCVGLNRKSKELKWPQWFCIKCN